MVPYHRISHENVDAGGDPQGCQDPSAGKHPAAHCGTDHRRAVSADPGAEREAGQESSARARAAEDCGTDGGGGSAAGHGGECAGS